MTRSNQNPHPLSRRVIASAESGADKVSKREDDLGTTDSSRSRMPFSCLDTSVEVFDMLMLHIVTQLSVGQRHPRILLEDMASSPQHSVHLEGGRLEQQSV